MNTTDTPTIHALNASPMLIADAVKNNPVAITVADEPIFYCINKALFQDFLAWKNNSTPLETNVVPHKKSIRDFAGILKNKTNVHLTIDEMNNAIAEAGKNSGLQGLERIDE